MSKRVAILANTDKPVGPVCQKIIQWCQKRKLKVILDALLLEHLQVQVRRRQTLSGDVKTANLILSLGGDGFLLHTVRTLYPCTIPILPVNLGSLGFNAQTTVEEVFAVLDTWRKGKRKIQQRILLEVSLKRKGRKLRSAPALNDVVLGKEATSRIINVEMWVDGAYATTYRGDGLIISTPTGSTAYNLAAFGPLIYPELEATVIVPLAPHTLRSRPLVLPSGKKIRLLYKRKKDREEPLLIVDGQEHINIKDKDEIHIQCARTRLKLLTSDKEMYFSSLRNKLRWGGELHV